MCNKYTRTQRRNRAIQKLYYILIITFQIHFGSQLDDCGDYFDGVVGRHGRLERLELKLALGLNATVAERVDFVGAAAVFLPCKSVAPDVDV